MMILQQRFFSSLIIDFVILNLLIWFLFLFLFEFF